MLLTYVSFKVLPESLNFSPSKFSYCISGSLTNWPFVYSFIFSVRFSSCDKRGYFPVVVCRLLTAGASLVAEPGL